MPFISSTVIVGLGPYDAYKFDDNAETRLTVSQEWDDDMLEMSG